MSMTYAGLSHADTVKATAPGLSPGTLPACTLAFLHSADVSTE